MSKQFDWNEIATAALYEYLTADFGKRLVVNESGHWYIQESNTFDLDEVASVNCPGIGNLDSTEFTESFVEWDEKKGAYITIPGYEDTQRTVGSLEDLIRECCEYGDMADSIGELAYALEQSVTR